ncbi:MAG: GspH/FimT family protein [Gemmatimonadota bacterium]|nr:GspH/FimT family protein [Gemmatimonadota bacterium]
MDRCGHSIIEIAMVLVILVALAPPLIGSAADLRRSFLLSRAREEAARLFAEARWVAVGEGGAIVVLNADPPWGAVVTTDGDTTKLSELGEGGVSLRLSRGRPNSRVRFGPLGLGLVSSQTLTFELGGEERRLVVSSLGRVSRR